MQTCGVKNDESIHAWGRGKMQGYVQGIKRGVSGRTRAAVRDSPGHCTTGTFPSMNGPAFQWEADVSGGCAQKRMFRPEEVQNDNGPGRPGRWFHNGAGSAWRRKHAAPA